MKQRPEWLWGWLVIGSFIVPALLLLVFGGLGMAIGHNLDGLLKRLGDVSGFAYVSVVSNLLARVLELKSHSRLGVVGRSLLLFFTGVGFMFAGIWALKLLVYCAGV